MSDAYKILIVEDDEVISNGICDGLKKWGYDAFCVKDFSLVEKTVEVTQPHLILLDVSLPYYNGFYHCREIRKFTTTPILFISSASDSLSLVTAMNLGGDDYISKPFDFDVLLAKITATLRRAYSYKSDSSRIDYDGVIVDVSASKVINNEKSVELTKSELKIIELLIVNGGKVVLKETIMRKLWQNDDFIDENALSVNIARLRKKLGELKISERLLCKKGQGYMFK